MVYYFFPHDLLLLFYFGKNCTTSSDMTFRNRSITHYFLCSTQYRILFYNITKAAQKERFA